MEIKAAPKVSPSPTPTPEPTPTPTPAKKIGGTLLAKMTAKGKTNLVISWNKVKVDGAWYNIDICWADTDNYTRWDLRCDADFANRQHWISGYDNGFIASPKNYY